MVFSRLSFMMLLQYAVWGLWLPQLAAYLTAPVEGGGLGFTVPQMGYIIGVAGSAGALFSPFVAGQLADRHFRVERVLAVLLSLGGVVIFTMAYQTTFIAWLVMAILYSILYMPTLALTNSVAFTNLSRPETQFPKVRVWGTIGWIVAAWVFPMVWLQTNLKVQALPPFLVGDEAPNVTSRLVDALKVSGVLSILYAVYCLTLPSTPPQKQAKDPLAFRRAFKLFTIPSLAVLMFAALIISTIHQMYFIMTSPYLVSRGLKESLIMPAMSIGQFAEIIIMALLGPVLVRSKFRWVIAIGCLAYFARYAVFGTLTLPLWVTVSSIALHGFCYACFFAAAYIYVDKIAPIDAKHSAQTVFGTVILGLGPILSAFVIPFLSAKFSDASGALDYRGFWYTLAGVGLATAILFVLFFRDETRKVDAEAA